MLSYEKRQRLLSLEDELTTIREEISKWEEDQHPRGKGGKFSTSTSTSEDSNNSSKESDSSQTNLWKWADNAFKVVSIASLAIPGLAGFRAAKVVFDSLRGLAAITAPFKFGTLSTAQFALEVAKDSVARNQLVKAAIQGIVSKINVRVDIAWAAMEFFLKHMAEKREAEINKAKEDPILQQLKFLSAVLERNKPKPQES